MRPRMVLGYAAAVLAMVTLVLSAYEGVRRFSRAGVVELLFAISAFATALVCIALVDWMLNLDRRTGRLGVEDEEEEAGQEMVAAARLYSPTGQADAELRSTFQSLERLANEELGAEKTLDEALKIVASFAKASALTLWMLDEAGEPKLRARFADGQLLPLDEAPPEATDPDALRQTIEHRKTFEVVEADRASLLVPLLCTQRCVGILKVVVPVAGSGEERTSAAQKVCSGLAQLARPFTHAARAPDLYDQAVVEPLTGLYSKRHFINRLTEATGASRRYGEPLSLVLMDIDRLKLINDSYGQATGDRVLQTLAALVQENTREADSAYRYGPDEFAIILAGTDSNRAMVLAERLRRAARSSRTLADEAGQIITSISVGVAEFDEDMRGIGTLIARAEEALYAAKAAGRDRVERWREGTSAAPTDEAE